MIINHNISALNAHRQLGANNNAVAKSLEKLSSGLRINRAGDDAAGLAISEKMRAQIRGLDMAQKNALDGISLIQTAEGGLNETHAILQRMRELVVQAGNTGTQGDDDLQAIQDEIDALIEELGGGTTKGISDRIQFNGKELLDGSFNGTFQIGANQEQQITLTIDDMSASALGVHDVNVLGTLGDPGDPDAEPPVPSTPAAPFDFDTEVEKIDNAIKEVSAQRSKLGAVQNRLEHTINNLGTSAENLTAAESRIRDVDHTEAA